MLKNAIYEEVTPNYKYEIENSKEIKEITKDCEQILSKIYKTFGFDFGSKVECMMWGVAGEMGDQMYIKGLKDGIKYFG